MYSRDRQGNTVSTFDGQGGIIRFLYGNPVGRGMVKLMVRPWVSKTAGWFLDRRISACFVGSFVRNNHIDLSQYEPVKYRSYNDFFCRKIRPELRPFDLDPCRLTAPCDAKLSAYPIGSDSCFEVKGSSYTMETLVRDKEVAEGYRGGWLLLFRLTVDDYHRYAWPADGVPGPETRIKGVLHTVNPVAAAARPIYKENSRAYTLLSTDAFGQVLMMEVGAMMVGRIVNRPVTGSVERGEEKGHFEFGGSTVILCLQPGRFTPDADILKNTADGFETVVKMGEGIGFANGYDRQ